MLEGGFLTETKSLYQRKDLYADLPSMRSVGYRQAWKYLEGEFDLDTMREKAIIRHAATCEKAINLVAK